MVDNSSDDWTTNHHWPVGSSQNVCCGQWVNIRLKRTCEAIRVALPVAFLFSSIHRAVETVGTRTSAALASPQFRGERGNCKKSITLEQSQHA